MKSTYYTALQVLAATYFGKKLPADNSEESTITKGIKISDDANNLATHFIKAVGQNLVLELRKCPKGTGINI